MATKKVGTTGRFGARYGKTVKKKVADIEAKMKVWHKCPYCNKQKVKREFAGVWKCRNCKAKFTGKAYLPK
ncbi:50S ribosomal protein L37ae [Candidatus Woesearchaeota archaeon]|nr:50S ribosomal protein L37ae [Candidatus Woesearchaeota archaeon]